MVVKKAGLQFIVEERDNSVIAKSLDNSWRLLIRSNRVNHDALALRGAPLYVSEQRLSEYDKNMVTGRALRGYHPDVQVYRPNPEHFVIEVGAGLGGFIEHFCRTLGEVNHPKPAVVDPLNYHWTAEMLTMVQGEVRDKLWHDLLGTYLARAELVLDSSQVHLVNSELSEVVNQGMLLGKADVLVDNYGANFYDPRALYVIDDRSDPNAIQRDERTLLKEGGIILGT